MIWVVSDGARRTPEPQLYVFDIVRGGNCYFKATEMQEELEARPTDDLQPLCEELGGLQKFDQELKLIEGIALQQGE
jgi:hypothetical protein